MHDKRLRCGIIRVEVKSIYIFMYLIIFF
jgi:hypothetical protein